MIVYNPPLKRLAMVHSVKDKREVEILADLGDNLFHARYNGVVCTAIFNIFTGCFYVDDKYGIIREENKEE